MKKPLGVVGLGLAPLLLHACGAPGPSERAFGDPVGNVAASLTPAAKSVRLGEVIEFRVTVRNLSGDQAIRWPDMNDPRCWGFGFTPLDERPGAYGCLASINGQGDRPVVPLSLPPSGEISFGAFLPKLWGGWSLTTQKDGSFTARAVDFPPPGRYRVSATYHPFHAHRPELEKLRGWGVTTNNVEIEVVR